MATAHLIPAAEQHRHISVEEYLRTSYRPDCDYVDGEVLERNLGEYDHARIQTLISYIFMANRVAWNINAVVECRYQVKPTRFRVPDIAVLPADTKVDRIIRSAPLICIEILSPEDTWRRMEIKINDYLEAGVRNVWIIDPETREAFRCDETGHHRITSGELTVPETPIQISLAEVFSALD